MDDYESGMSVIDKANHISICGGGGYNRHRLLSTFLIIISAIVLVITSISLFSVSDKAYAAQPTTGTRAIADVLGISRDDFVSWLSSHENDGYYIGTRYCDNYYETIYPNGGGKASPTTGLYGMNCTGFVYHALVSVGSDPKNTPNFLPINQAQKNDAGAGRWWTWANNNNLVRYDFNTKQEMLDSGILEKGDIIWMFERGLMGQASDYHHIGIFWGNTPSEDRMWHSSSTNARGNDITAITPKKANSTYSVYKMTLSGSIDLQKATASPQITDGNPNYVVSNAQYGVYYNSNDANTDSNRVATIITDLNGYGKVDGIKVGTYCVKEIASSAFYAVDPTIYTVTVKGGSTVRVNVNNVLEVPTDNEAPSLSKHDYILKTDTPQGDAELAGAQFTVKFYYEINTQQQGTPIRTWILQTDENGKIAFDDAHKVGGDDFYRQNGEIVIPIGSISWQETKAPVGYNINDEIQRFSSTTGTFPAAINTDDQVQRGGFAIQKYDDEIDSTIEQGDASFEGVKFNVYNRSKNPVYVNGTVYNVDDVCFTFSLNSDGYYQSSDDLLPYGTYEIKEVSESADGAYQQNSEWSYTFDIRTDGEIDTGATLLENAPQNKPDRGGFEIQKYDDEIDSTIEQGDASFEGVKFNVYNRSKQHVKVNGTTYEVGDVCFTFTINKDGYFKSSNDLLPYGTYEIKEVSESADGAYKQNADWSYTFDIRNNGEIDTGAKLLENAPQNLPDRGGFKIQKWDAELDRTEPQGDGSFVGIEFEVINRSASHVWVHDEDGNYELYEPGEVCYRFVLEPDENGYGHYTSPANLLPYGTYEFREVSGSPDGAYYVNSEWSVTDTIRYEGDIMDLTSQSVGPNDQVLRGGIGVQKFASEVSDDTINQSINGTFPDINLQSTLMIGTGDDRIYAADSDSFVNMILVAAEGMDQLTADMFGMSYDENQTTASDPMATTQAGAAFKGAEVTIYNTSKHSVNIIGRGVIPPATPDTVTDANIVAVLVLDENGYAETGDRDLPYGTYTLKETKAPKGYHLNTDWCKTVQVREEKKIVEVGALPEDSTIYSGVDDQVMRGDYKFIKNASDTQSTMPYTPFLIVNLQSGENHVVVTNENGEFYSHSFTNDGQPYNLHSTNTNANDDAITWHEDGTYTIDDTKLDNMAGVWFTGYGPLNDPNNVLAPRVDPNDNLGAFPYGDYAVIELMADANSGYENVVRTFTITREGFEINGGTITDKWKNIELKTTAKDAVTGTNHGSIENDTTTIIDTVEFSEGLRANETYTFTGVLMDKATNEAITDNDGNEITASAQHLVTEDEAANGGTVDVEFADIPTELLRGKVTVVFEDCYDEAGTWIAAHADIDDEGQTVYYPEIHTTATDNVTGQHEGDATSTDTVTINDVVDYNGLQPGKTYTMTGTLMDKETGKAFEGIEPVSTEFTPEESNGSVTMTFEVPAELLRGKTTVVFENCYLDEAEVAVHADIDDEGQTVSYPDIHTTATDGLDGDKTFSGQQTVTLVDTVEYSNLTPGVEYTMTGTLMDKETGAPVEGVEPVSQTFTPETADGTMEMTFTFNVVDLVGHDIVVFENCYRDFDASGELIQVAQHADINDEGQTVNVRDAGLADDIINDNPLAQTGENSIPFVIAGFIMMMTMICTPIALNIMRKRKI